MARWYEAQYKKPLGHGIWYVKVKKTEEGRVVVWNGHHFITSLTQEEAREQLNLFGVCEGNQERIQSDFTFYLHY